jgi:UDP-N-acetylmuramate--alanine ligase
MIIHFIGIGGIGMSALAEICLERGDRVSGSDLKENDRTRALQQRGASIFYGHSRDHIPEKCQKVIFTSAVGPDNPEWDEALKREIPLISRGIFLADLFKEKEVYGVVGSHGKTTTASFTASALLALEGEKASYYIGGILSQTGRNGHWGEGYRASVELDESDGSFLSFQKGEAALITNIELEHVDNYRNEERYREAFQEFVENFRGPVFAGEEAAGKLKKAGSGLVTVGLKRGRIRPDEWGDDYFRIGKRTCHLKKRGTHNVFDAFLAYAALSETGCDPDKVFQGLEMYEGTGRRMELLARKGGIAVYDDYGHHPTEIEAALRGEESKAPTMILFQPHRYTRFKMFYRRFLEVFRNRGDFIVVLPVYGASEKKVKSPDGMDFVKELSSFRSGVFYAGGVDEAYHLMRSLLSSPMTVISFGAGDGNLAVRRLARDVGEEESWPM